VSTRYIVGIDQSTQGTKALLLDEKGSCVGMKAVPHRQIINDKGWVEHDLEEIARNVIEAVKGVLAETRVDPGTVAGVGVANQRETIALWDRNGGRPVYNAIVWQCNRGARICERIEQEGAAEEVRERTGLKLSPYFSAAKLAWILEQVPGTRERAERGELVCGTMESWVIYRLTKGKACKTDYSNASRTQMFNIHTMSWDEEVCRIFGIPMACLPEVCDSDAQFGETDFDGLLPAPVPIHAAFGDSHCSLFAHNCHDRGTAMTGYGTGSCVLFNIGDRPILSRHGVSTSVGWRIGGKTVYVFDGVINYSGAVITWLLKDVGLISSPQESEALARAANKGDTTYLVPAFSGIGAPYWKSDIAAAFTGMTRLTGRAELVKAALESIAYQIADVIEAMSADAGFPLVEMRVSGAPAQNGYLMQFQSDLIGCPVLVPEFEELSAMGAAYAAGFALGMYTRDHITANNRYRTIRPNISEQERMAKWSGWKRAVRMLTENQS